MIFRRKPDWSTILMREVAAADKRDFEWGKHDCCLFACDVVKAITGMDLAAPFRGKYSSLPEAVALLRQYVKQQYTVGHEVTAVARKIASDNGLQEVPALKAWRGDIALLPGSTGLETNLGIVIGEAVVGAWFGDPGTMQYPLRQAIQVWRI